LIIKLQICTRLINYRWIVSD